MDLVFRGRAMMPDGVRTVAVGVQAGRIALVADADAPLVTTTEVLLADDEVLLPGVVDTHVHVNEPGRTEWEGFASATAAAAAGGVTTIIDMPLNSIPPTVDRAALEVKRARAGAVARVDVGFWGGAIPSNLGRLRDLHDAGVFGFKAFLAPSGVDEFPHLSVDELERALAEVASFDGLLIVHAEDPVVLEAHPGRGGRSYPAFVSTRPPEAEAVAVQRVIDGVRRTGARAHILHVSSSAVLPLLARAKADGLRITAETCPHYLTISEEEVPEGGTQFKCCPPIRDAANRDLLWAALLDGTLDCVVTDHSPSTVALKTAGGGDFDAAWGGIAGLQVGFAATWTEAERRGIPLSRVVSWMTASTADLAGLTAKGRLREGADADLVVFAPDETFRVDAASLKHKNPVTAYDGRLLRGVARDTYLRGRPTGGAPHGTLLSRTE
ncbi:allantoinase AllB [Leifsonia sp. AG29]|uniref:allantoinase AllB n=1 Tax=Leifsonia sp. AG29 TaxID=2598860 RepID=UPI00131D5B64|nr:allantoinase AllB [Leifsonia sp. AG29]